MAGNRYAESVEHDYPTEPSEKNPCHQADIDRLASIEDINISPGEESSIDLKLVKDWYFATENLSRVVSNTLQSIAPQTVNQLRYAGHHILKAVTFDEDNADEIHSNLIEAYKHCKRGYFDALDLFVYETNRIFQGRVINIEDTPTKGRVVDELLRLINSINEQRLSSKTRVEYYRFLQDELVKAQGVFAEINRLTLPQVKALEFDLEDALEDKERVESERNQYEAENKKLIEDIKHTRAKTTNYLIVGGVTALATIFLAVATLYQGYYTAKNIVPESKHTLKTETLFPKIGCSPSAQMDGEQLLPESDTGESTSNKP